MTRPPDMLRFLGGPVGKLEVGWNGPWPPPETLRVAYGRQSGLAKVIDSNLTGLLERELAASSTIVVTTYRLRSASSLPDDFDEPNVVRGAEYAAEDET